MATLSILKLVRNWPNNGVLNLALCCGAIWRHREKPQNRCTTTVHPVYNCWKKKILENLLTVGLLVRTNLFIANRFWAIYTNLDTCCQRYIATYGNFFLYRCRSTFSALNNCGGIFFKSLSYLCEVVRTIFSADFWTFRNFWQQFRENCGVIQRSIWELCSASERAIICEKRWKPRPNRPINRNTMLVRTMHSSNARRSGLGAWQTKLETLETKASPRRQCSTGRIRAYYVGGGGKEANCLHMEVEGNFPSLGGGFY